MKKIELIEIYSDIITYAIYTGNYNLRLAVEKQLNKIYDSVNL